MVGFHLFLRSRLAYIATYIGFGLVMTTLVQLDLWLSHSSLTFTNILYLWLLALLGLIAFLAFDYRRWVEYLRRLDGVDSTESLDHLGLLPEAKTWEQRVFTRAWETLYARLRAEVISEQQRGRRHIDLVSQWAHHMKTPVAIIDLELQKARKQDGLQNSTEFLDSLAEENQRLQQSLQTLLNIVRLEDFGSDFHIQPVNLSEMVRRLVNDHKREFIVQQVYPQVDIPSSCIIKSDAKWLRFVIEQITNNAIKYSSGTERPGKVVIRSISDNGDTILEINDNGIGIPPEDLGRVFTPFYTGINGRHYPQATGMGLYLAQDICQRLGHQLRLESSLGEGTQVHLRFLSEKATFTGLKAKLTR